MTGQESSEPSTSTPQRDSTLDRAAAAGPLPEPADDDEPGGGTEEHVQDSTEQGANASFLGIHLNP